MFERYTEKARRVIFFARYEASQFGSPYIETEHLLLGVLREDKALTNRFLRSHAAIESIRKQIEGRTPVREKVSTSVDLPLSQECKRVLAFAAEEAERLSHKHIGTEHLLLGLLREDKSFAAEILHERGLRLSALREELTRAQNEKAATSRPKEASLSPNSAATSPSAQWRTNSTLWSDAKPNLSGRSRSSAAGPRITPSSLGSLVSARPPSWKVWRNALRMAMCLPFSPTSGSWRWTFL